jgi:hypothetical protein
MSPVLARRVEALGGVLLAIAASVLMLRPVTPASSNLGAITVSSGTPGQAGGVPANALRAPTRLHEQLMVETKLQSIATAKRVTPETARDPEILFSEGDGGGEEVDDGDGGGGEPETVTSDCAATTQPVLSCVPVCWTSEAIASCKIECHETVEAVVSCQIWCQPTTQPIASCGLVCDTSQWVQSCKYGCPPTAAPVVTCQYGPCDTTAGVPTCASTCAPAATCAGTCAPVATCTSTCSPMLTCAPTCAPVSTCTGTCAPVSTCAGTCAPTATCADTCDQTDTCGGMDTCNDACTWTPDCETFNPIESCLFECDTTFPINSCKYDCPPSMGPASSCRYACDTTQVVASCEMQCEETYAPISTCKYACPCEVVIQPHCKFITPGQAVVICAIGQPPGGSFSWQIIAGMGHVVFIGSTNLPCVVLMGVSPTSYEGVQLKVTYTVNGCTDTDVTTLTVYTMDAIVSVPGAVDPARPDVPAALEDAAGAPIIVNDDDDNINFTSDLTENPVWLEDDLAKVRVVFNPVVPVGTIRFDVLVGGDKVAAWQDSLKLVPYIWGTVRPVANANSKFIFVEASKRSLAAGDITVWAIYNAPDPTGGVSGNNCFATESVNLTSYRLDLDVDTDRDYGTPTGGIEDVEDEDKEELWTNLRGAITNVNYDADVARIDAGLPAGKFPINKLSDSILIDGDGVPYRGTMGVGAGGVRYDEIDGAADEQDITPLILRKLGPALPAGWTVELVFNDVDERQAMHLFKRIKAAQRSIWGGLGSRAVPPETVPPDRIAVQQYVGVGGSDYQGGFAIPDGFDGAADGDWVFGMEPFFFRFLRTPAAAGPLVFDGEFELDVELKNGAILVRTDSVRLKVAPWQAISHAQPAPEAWLKDEGPSNAAFIAAFPANRPVVDLNQWAQDHAEIGWYQRPGGPKTHCTFALPYLREEPIGSGVSEQPKWMWNHLWGAGHGVFQIGRDLSGGRGDYGGNIELMPPNATRKLGALIVGDKMSDELMDFLESQQVQQLQAVPTKWLRVGHVDEVIAFQTVADRVSIADPSDGWTKAQAYPSRDSAVAFVDGAAGGPQHVTTVAVPPTTTSTFTFTVAAAPPAGSKYVRFIDSAASGSGSEGQIARIVGSPTTSVTVDLVYLVGKRVAPPPGLDPHALPAAGTWGANPVDAGAAALSVWAFRHTKPHPLFAHAAGTWFKKPLAGDKVVFVPECRKYAAYADLDTGTWSNTLGTNVPAAIDMNPWSLAADPELNWINATMGVGALERIADIKTKLNSVAGVALTYDPIPAVYVGRTGVVFATDGMAEAFIPGMVNYQSVLGAGGQQQFYPDPLMPHLGGVDPFEAAAVANAGLDVPTDDWTTYHRNMGETHCGTNVVRDFPGFDWWTQL